MRFGLERKRPPMTDAEFVMLCRLLRGHCGLHFGPESRYLLESRLGRRLVDLGLHSYTAYHYLLRRDPGATGELGWAIDELTTNETYFFRERRQLDALIQEILPELRLRREARGGGPITIWSAGCSSGEEPYSVVMLALEAGIDPNRELRIFASDISRRMLQKAREGIYRESSFRDTEPHLRAKYFVEKDGRWRIRDEVKRHVHFAHLNLLDRSRGALLGAMDVVLCRNVIIYFDTETKRQVVHLFAEKIRPGGYLLLGHSESLINISNEFALKHLRHELVYRKPDPEESPADLWHAAARAVLAKRRLEEGLE